MENELYAMDLRTPTIRPSPADVTFQFGVPWLAAAFQNGRVQVDRFLCAFEKRRQAAALQRTPFYQIS